MVEELYKRIPAVDRILETDRVRKALEDYPRKLIVESLRETGSSWRRMIRAGKVCEDDLGQDRFIEEALTLAYSKLRSSLVRVINATGVILNTNLGRAPLNDSAIAELLRISSGYSNLEFDLHKGDRGHRHVHVEGALRKLTGAKAALVVNNNAAAVLLILDTFARRREVIVSRGELIEIGGSFRLPDVLKKSGAKLVPVGTTNRTYISDYEDAITDRTAILLKSHTSNYKVIGFVHRPEPEKLAKVARRHRVMCVEDLGSGLLVDLTSFGLEEPTVQQGVRAGMDLVTFSGDKLLGGPQCGIVLGKAKWIGELGRNPLMRAMRVDKMTLSVLARTLSVYLYSDDPLEEIPHLRMITEPAGQIKRRALRVARSIAAAEGYEVSLVESGAAVGGGSCPGLEIPSWAVRIKPSGSSPDRFGRMLRRQSPPVVATVYEDSVNLDLRTVLPGEMKILTAVLKSVMI